MADKVQCWKCGITVDPEIHRSSECKGCNADLMVCKMCTFYNPSMSDHCDEPAADYVSEVERANFCDYFKVKAGAFQARASDNNKAMEELNALFGINNNVDNVKNDDKTELDSLFKKS